MRLKPALILLGVVVLVQLASARALDSIGLIEGLLSPSAASPALLVPLAFVFYAARLFAWFVAPGLVLGALVVSFRPDPQERV